MAKIIGSTTTTPMRISDWNQTNPLRADYIKNKPDLSLKADVSYVDGLLGDTNAALDHIIAIQNELIGGGSV